jgi:hypothetical protein
MPKTAPYKNVTDTIDLLQKSYSILKNLKCFGAEHPKDARTCDSVGQVGALYSLNLDTSLR